MKEIVLISFERRFQRFVPLRAPSFIARITAILFCCGFSVNAQPPPRPVASWVSEGVKGGETILICGDGFETGKTRVFSWIPPQLPEADWTNKATQRSSLEKFLKATPNLVSDKPKDAVQLEIAEQTQHTLAVLTHAGKINSEQIGVQVVWIGTTAGVSEPVIVNRPLLWWSSPESLVPGQTVRVFGRNLFSLYGAGRAAFLKSASGELLPLEWGTSYEMEYDRSTRMNEFELRLPENVAPGRYELFIHNGSGGDMGWSEPIEISVGARKTSPERIFKAADYGAIPDDNNDCGPVLERALGEASRAGGGLVLVPPGTFGLTRTLVVPSGVILRGAGVGLTRLVVLADQPFRSELRMTNPTPEQKVYFGLAKKIAPLVFLPDQCGLERLTVEGNRDVICAFIGGIGRPSQDIALRDVELLNRGGVWKPEGEYRMAANCCVVAGPIHGLKLLNSRLEGARCFFALPGLNQRAIISGNHFQSYPPGRSDAFCLRDPIECLIENNFFTESKRGIVVQPQPPCGMAIHNVFARNVIEHIGRGENAGETELWEIGGGKAFDKVKTAGPQYLVSTVARWKTNELSGLLCLITDGRGLGQYRLIRENTEDRLILDRPWQVIPGEGARFTVTMAAIENIIMDDTDRDGEAALALWGACIGNVISRQIMTDTEGAILHGWDLRKKMGSQAGIAPCWFNDLRQLRFSKGARLDLRPSRNRGSEFDDAGALVFGNTIRECVFGDGPRAPMQNQWGPFWEWKSYRDRFAQGNELPWNAAIALECMLGWGSDPDDPVWANREPGVAFNLIERNFIEHWPVGIYQARSAGENILGKNQFVATGTNVVIVGRSP